MKIVAIHEIYYTDKNGNNAIATPGEIFDIPESIATGLLKGVFPAARRLTDQEVELDKLRLQSIAKAARAEKSEKSDK